MMVKVPSILLAEDDPADVELFLEALAEHGLAGRVAVARDGVEALDYLRRRGAFADREPGDPVVALLDIKMPRMDGLEVLREMRGDPALARLPVVILTSSDEERDVVASYDLGVSAYVMKSAASDAVEILVGVLLLQGLLTALGDAGAAGLETLDLDHLDLSGFIEAVKQLGVFRAMLGEPPPEVGT